MVASSDDATILLSSTLTPTQGLHTTSTTCLSLHRGDRSLSSSCTLHLYFALPTQLFADPYELAHRRASYGFERFGGGDLEAPAFAPGAGADAPAGLLLDLVIAGGIAGEGEDDRTRNSVIQIDVPLHARYGVPKTVGELIDEVALPPPEAFWACPTTSSRHVEGAPGGFMLRFVLPPLGESDSLLLLTILYVCTTKDTQIPDALRKVVELAPALVGGGERTLVSIPRVESVRTQTLRVPVGDAGDVAMVETGTIVVVLLAFVYLTRTIVRASRVRFGAVYVSVAKED